MEGERDESVHRTAKALAAGAFCVAIAGLAFLAVRVTAGDTGQSPVLDRHPPSVARGVLEVDYAID
jgi:hypothetical protein